MTISTITLPLPPSANRMYRRAGGHMHKSTEYRAWLDNAMRVVAASWDPPALEWYGLGITLPPTRRDPDNSIKALSDALQAGGAVVNDRMLRTLILTVDDNRAPEDGVLLTLWGVDAPAKKVKRRARKT